MNILAPSNKHLLLEEPNDTENSFIANVNSVAKLLPTLTELNDNLGDKQRTDLLVKLAEISTDGLAEDLDKDTFDGKRQIEINLLKNFTDYSNDLSNTEKLELWTDTTKHVFYESVIVVFTDGTSIYKMFEQSGSYIKIHTHKQLYQQLNNWVDFKKYANYTVIDVCEDTPLTGLDVIRIVDGEDSGSSIEKIILQKSSDDILAKTTTPIYTWLDSTSAIKLAVLYLKCFESLAKNLPELREMYGHLSDLLTIYTHIPHLHEVYKNLGTLGNIHENLDSLTSLGTYIETLLLDKKAEKIPYQITQYKVEVVPNKINFTTGYKVNDKLTCDEVPIVLTVTEVDSTGMIKAVKFVPSVINTNATGLYPFKSSNNSSVLDTGIVCTPHAYNYDKQWDLEDVYNMLENKIGAFTKAIKTILSRLEETVVTMQTSLSGQYTREGYVVFMGDNVTPTVILPNDYISGVPLEYNMGKHQLVVTFNGLTLIENINYTEVSSTSIKLLFNVKQGDEIHFRLTTWSE